MMPLCVKNYGSGILDVPCVRVGPSRLRYSPLLDRSCGRAVPSAIRYWCIIVGSLVCGPIYGFQHINLGHQAAELEVRPTAPEVLP